MIDEEKAKAFPIATEILVAALQSKVVILESDKHTGAEAGRSLGQTFDALCVSIVKTLREPVLKTPAHCGSKT